jgi:3-oxoacyl-[acyl-carrier protein] reductase
LSEVVSRQDAKQTIKIQNMKLDGKVAIVTGGARDLGRAVSVKLASEGAKIVINYYDNYDDAVETLAIIEKNNGQAIIVGGDMTKADDVDRLVAEGQKAFGQQIDILVNVVGGIVGRKAITEQDEKWYDFLMDVNMKSCWLCTRAVVPFMGAGSSIVNFSSLAARDGGGPGASMYATAKGAVLTFTRSMAKELGPKGIRVNALAPGTIATSFHDRFNTPENRERMKQVYPLRREGDAGDIADLVAFLASGDSDYITGTNIDINGGMYFS